jgi:hypothetical protein
MHAANSTALCGTGMVDLRDGFMPSGNSQFFGTENARQKPSGIANALAFNKFEASQRQIRDRKSAHRTAS